MDSLLNASGQQLPNNHFVDSQVKVVEKFLSRAKLFSGSIAKHKFRVKLFVFCATCKKHNESNWLLL